MGKIYNNPSTDVVYVEDTDGRLVWSTNNDRRPVNLLPEADRILINRNISFPDFTKFCNYAHQRVSATDGNRPPWALTGSGDTCQTVTMIEPEERTLTETVIGSVPSGVNYIDVRVKVTRTKDPNTYLDQSVPQLIATDRLVHLPGGSCLIEATGIWRRLFHIVLDGTDIVLRRKQSVAPVPSDAYDRYGAIYDNSSPNRDPFTTDSYASWGWVSSETSGWRGTQRDGHPAALIEVKEYSANNGASTPTMGAKHPQRERRCSIDTSQHDFSSTYNADIEIRPGYMPP